MIDKSLRYNYQWGGPGGKSPGASSSGGGGHDRGGQQHQATARAAVQAAKSQPVARSAPDPYRGGQVIVHTPPKTEYITKKEPTIVAPITRDVMPIVPTATKRPTQMLDIAGDIKAQQKLQEDIRESQRTGAYAKELGLPSIKRDVIPSPIINPWEETRDAGKLAEITNLGDDAKTRHVQLLQKKADLSWANKSTREKEEQQEKWDAAESKIKLQKEGGFWKSLGNIALAILLPALLPAKLATAYKLANVAKTATTFAKKHNLFSSDQDAVQYVKKMIGGKDLSSLIAGDKNVIAKNIAKFSGHDLTVNAQDEYRKRRRIVQDILNKGSYQGKELTGEQRNQLLNYIEQISKFLNVDPMEVAYGGRIDRPLTGRSRYI